MGPEGLKFNPSGPLSDYATYPILKDYRDDKIVRAEKQDFSS